MTIQLDELADLEGFVHVRFAFTLPKDELELHPDHLDGIMMRDQGKFEECYLVGLLQYLARHYGHRMQTEIFEPLLDSVVERAKEFGETGIDHDRAICIRGAFEDALLSRYVRPTT